MSLSEIDTLRHLRRHRADRAERELWRAKSAQAALRAQIEQAQFTLEQSRLHEARQSAELASQHQGQVLSLQALKAWSTKERSLSAGTAREEVQLRALHERQESHKALIEHAQQQVSQCLKGVEKLRELVELLAEETP